MKFLLLPRLGKQMRVCVGRGRLFGLLPLPYSFSWGLRGVRGGLVVACVMNEKEQLLACFTPEELTPKFRALLDLYFDANVQPCAGCELDAHYQTGLPYMFETPELYQQHGHRLVVIGQATGSGSLYALLRPETFQPVDAWPVVVLGDEGGAGVLAQDLNDWLRFMTLNVEPYVHSELGYDEATGTYKHVADTFDLFDEHEGEEADEDEHHTAYLAWLDSYGLTALTSIEQAQTEIIAPAQARYQAELNGLVMA
jgi:hypothetical protein